MTPTPTPTTAPVALIEFAFDNVITSNDVTLQGRTQTFTLGDNIAWELLLPPASGTERMEVAIVDATTGTTLSTYPFTPNPGSNLFYGKTPDLISRPGTYYMRYYSDSVLVGQGQFTVVEAAPTNDPNAGCDPSYPTVCIPPWPPDLDCKDIPYRDFEVTGSDPHGFDGDFDGIGCESGGGGGGATPRPTKKPNGGGGGGGGGGSNCEPSYPTLCLPRPGPDLDCGDISAGNFPVVGSDPYRFDGDGDGVGCET